MSARTRMQAVMLLAATLASAAPIARAERPPAAGIAEDGRFPAAGGFSPGEFRFTPTVPDDGLGTAGGWQEATARLRIVDMRHLMPRIWSCLLTVGMPLRTAGEGSIAPETAAIRSAAIATQASSAVMHRQPEWLPAAYCKQLGDEMTALFRGQHPRLGARARGR